MGKKRRLDYICQVCNSSFINQFSLFEHKSLHTNERPFMCMKCSRHFALIEHYVNHYPDCSAGSFVFAEDDNKLRKMENKHDNIDNLEGSPPCKITTYHAGNELNIEPIQYKKSYICYVCHKSFSSVKLIKQHKKYFPGEQCFSCELCKKRYHTKKRLDNHLCVDNALLPTRTIMCSCLETFNSLEEFRSHVGPESLTCCSCKMDFKGIVNLIKHVRYVIPSYRYTECRGFSPFPLSPVKAQLIMAGWQ